MEEKCLFLDEQAGRVNQETKEWHKPSAICRAKYPVDCPKKRLPYEVTCTCWRIRK